MEPTRTPIRSIHPTKPIKRPKLKPLWRHHILYFLQYFREAPKSEFLPIQKQDFWSVSFDWSIKLNNT
ncbi:unnamed protein product [Blepharisma stoltei]|uniref:Uncharacterized protein n=1 Tax=Blepharisma stoltei TaxID=1481888 RepID=A0AAU9K1D5_9CILI|nr:unnamed protein product [Blepharisma stoltei]